MTQKEKLKIAGIRFAKVLVSVIIAGIGVKYGKSELYLLISPILVAIDKYVRI